MSFVMENFFTNDNKKGLLYLLRGNGVVANESVAAKICQGIGQQLPSVANDLLDLVSLTGQWKTNMVLLRDKINNSNVYAFSLSDNEVLIKPLNHLNMTATVCSNRILMNNDYNDKMLTTFKILSFSGIMVILVLLVLLLLLLLLPSSNNRNTLRRSQHFSNLPSLDSMSINRGTIV